MLDKRLNPGTQIYREMLSHIPLFAHRKPQTVAFLDESQSGLAAEILKHTCVTTVWQVGLLQNNRLEDGRLKTFPGNLSEFLLQAPKDSLDILIIGSPDVVDLKVCFQALHSEGIFIQLSESSYDLMVYKTRGQSLKLAGFADVLPIHFGLHAAIIAIKEGAINRPREKDIYNKPFSTEYYNLDMHKAAFALPEFMREELAID